LPRLRAGSSSLQFIAPPKRQTSAPVKRLPPRPRRLGRAGRTESFGTGGGRRYPAADCTALTRQVLPPRIVGIPSALSPSAIRCQVWPDALAWLIRSATSGIASTTAGREIARPCFRFSAKAVDVRSEMASGSHSPRAAMTLATRRPLALAVFRPRSETTSTAPARSNHLIRFTASIRDLLNRSSLARRASA
jgi:hypothetical protein